VKLLPVQLLDIPNATLFVGGRVKCRRFWSHQTQANGGGPLPTKTIPPHSKKHFRKEVTECMIEQRERGRPASVSLPLRVRGRPLVKSTMRMWCTGNSPCRFARRSRAKCA